MWKGRKRGTGIDKLWQKAWDNPDTLPVEKKEELLSAIHQRMNASASLGRRVVYIVSGAAAAILVTIVARQVWVNTKLAPVAEWNTIASNNENKKVILSDSSVIWLAPHSVVRLYPQFTRHRSVLLDKGTAFFEVTKDKDHPFQVNVNSQEVQVLGTAFTLERKDTVDIDLAVKEGSVALRSNEQRVVVHGGEQVSTTHKQVNAVARMMAMPADWWLQEEVRLLDVSLSELVTRIERYYHVQLNTEGVKWNTRVSLTWYFTQPLEKNLEVLNQLTGNTIH
ncbi:anti-sigma factor [Filimonas lacunae]|nr:anti-sigma factor [Filimonas lacunae]